MTNVITRRKKFFDTIIMQQCEKCGNIPQELSRNWLGYNENSAEMEISCSRCGYTFKIKVSEVDNG